jgi:hypothetical protein
MMPPGHVFASSVELFSFANRSAAKVSAVVAIFACLSAAEVRANVFGNVPEAAEYNVAYELNIPLDGGFQGAVPVPYSINNSATAAPGGFDRVAYYFEITQASGTSWVYASMDAFTTQVGQTGLPHAVNNPVTFQQRVDNLSVQSNVVGMKTGSFDRGQIEFWHHSYSAANGTSVFAASATTNDWGDTIGTTASGYGSFQIHNPGSRQVLFAYNRWASAGVSDDVGIGNSTGTHPDWTFASNSGNSTSRKLVVLVRPKRFNVNFSAVPMNGQVTPRNVAANTAVISIAGNETLGGFDKAVLKTFRNGVPQGPDIEQSLVYAGGSASFSFAPTIPAELASYAFEVHLQQGANRFLVRRVSDVTAGDVYLWYGQSNAQSNLYSGSAAAYASPWIRTFGMSSDSAIVTEAYNFWVEGVGDGSLNVPGGVGQWPLVVGRKIVDTYSIPVAILNGARGGYAMTKLQRDDANPDLLSDTGTTVFRVYNRLRYRAIQAKVAGAVRGIFFYQGESDSNNTAQHITGFGSLMTDWRVDYPALEKVFVTQLHVGCGAVTRELPELRDAQRMLPDVYEEVRIMSTNGLTTHTDNCHFPFVGGYETHGLNSFRQVRRELYNAPDAPAIDAPNPARVEIANLAADRLRIVMRKAGAGLVVDSGALVDFRLSGSSAILLSATVTQDSIELQYDRPVSGATRLDYLAHIGSAGGWVRNSNGVGLLAFSEPIISTYPILTLISPTGVTELLPGSIYQLSASASTAAASITRMEILIDGILHTAVNASGSITANWTVPPSGIHTIVFRATNNLGETTEKSVAIVAGTIPSPGGVSQGLSVWLKPERGIIRDASGAVSSWQDSVSINNSCVQANTAAKPSYAANVFGPMPGVTFGGDDFLAAPSGMSTGSYTKVVRVLLSDLSQPGNMLSSAGPSGTLRHALFMSSTAFPRLWHNSSFATSITAMVANQAHILTGTYDAVSNTGTLYLDGIQVGSGLSPSNNDNSDSTYQLGAIAASNFLRGSIGEAIIYNRVLGNTERASVETYLTNKVLPPPAAPRLGYVTWRNNNITPPADNSPQGDANSNGIPNLVEFALGLDPGAPGSPPTLEISTTPGMVDVRYTRPTDRTGVSWQLIESSDLLEWFPVTDLPGPASGGIEERFFKRPLNPNEQVFYALRVTLVP